VYSADGHLLEPIDLFKTRLPAHMRDRALWEEEFEIEPFVEGSHRVFRRLHSPGYEGWCVSRYHQGDGRTPEGDPDLILEDLDEDGIDATMLYPNLSLFALFTDDHELSINHARVYNDYLIERFLPYKARLRPACPIPLTDVGDAVAEIERVANAGLGALLFPAIPPTPYTAADYDPVWAAAQACGLPVFFHTATGGVKVKEPDAEFLKIITRSGEMARMPMTSELAAERMMSGAISLAFVPQQLIIQLIAGGVPERFPKLQFCLIEFNGNWLASLMGAMDKTWVTGIGQDSDWWGGFWDTSRPDDDQPKMAQIFRVNQNWLYPLKPSEYVKRQFHVGFQDDPTAVACRHVTGLSTLMWGNDYPHAEGTFRRSRELRASLFADVPDAERRAIVGGTLAGLVGFDRVSAEV
jgi:predicted TIM-barrel fold metal-dependent hydrolase